ncbi:hypothetical protein TB2_006535 [Malus domestica]
MPKFLRNQCGYNRRRFSSSGQWSRKLRRAQCQILAVSGNDFKAIGAEPVTAKQQQSFEVSKRSSQELKALITHRYPLQPQLLELRVFSSEHIYPRPNVAAPIRRHQIEVRKPRLPLQGHALDVGKPPGHDLRRHGVAVSDEDVAVRVSLYVVPVLANQRDGAPVLG